MERVLGERLRLAFAVGFAIALLVSSFACATAPRITKDELRAALDNPDLIVVDDRSGRDWTSSEYKIKGALRVPPGEEETWAARYPKDKMIVFYCA
jgi:Rhodanese-like domain